MQTLLMNYTIPMTSHSCFKHECEVVGIVQFMSSVCMKKLFEGLDLNQEGEALTDSLECRPWG